MKKITLLVLATLTLVAVSCGVNSLNPEKLELQKLPVSGALVTEYSEIAITGTQDKTVTYYKYTGVSAPATGKAFTGVAIVTNNIAGAFFTTEANIEVVLDNTGSIDSYTVSLFDVAYTPPADPANPPTPPTYPIITMQVSTTRDTTTVGDTNKLAITKPSTDGTIAVAATPALTYPVPGYKVDGGTGPSGTGPSHKAYFATAKKDSEIFTKPLGRNITLNASGTGGTIAIPASADGTPLNGGKYKIWVLEIYKQP